MGPSNGAVEGKRSIYCTSTAGQAHKHSLEGSTIIDFSGLQEGWPDLRAVFTLTIKFPSPVTITVSPQLYSFSAACPLDG